jgi:integrase
MSDPTNAPALKSRPWGAIRQRGPRYYVRFTAGGTRHERGPYSTWNTADKMMRRARALIEGGTPVAEVLAAVFGDFHGSTLTFRDAAPLYLEAAAAGATGRKRNKPKKASTLAIDTVRLGLLCAATWAGKPLARVEADEIEKWAESRVTAGASVATVNRDLALGSALYTWAMYRKHVEANPFRRVPRYDESGRAREVYLTAAECDVLLSACSDDVRPLVLAGIHTGAREGQLIALEWRDVDFARCIVRFRGEEEKSGEGRDVPMTQALEACLLALKKRRTVPLKGPDLVFRRQGKRWQGQTVLDHLARAVAACGKDAPEERRIAETKRTDLHFHDLRHTAASLLVAAGVPLFDVAKILGHKRIETTMRYAHFAPKAGRDAVDRLGAALATAAIGG